MSEKNKNVSLAPSATERYSNGAYETGGYLPAFYYQNYTQEWPVLMPHLFDWTNKRPGIKSQTINARNAGIFGAPARISLATAPNIYDPSKTDSIIVETPEHFNMGVSPKVKSRVASSEPSNIEGFNLGVNLLDWPTLRKRWELAKKAIQ